MKELFWHTLIALAIFGTVMMMVVLANRTNEHPKHHYVAPKVIRRVIKDTIDERGLISIIFSDDRGGKIDTFGLDYITQGACDSLIQGYDTLSLYGKIYILNK